MKRARHMSQGAFAGLLCVAFLFWSIAPSFTHAPTVFETIQDHLDMVEDHGHSHGFEEDLYWAMHGHSHDVADHDHSQACLPPGDNAPHDPQTTDRWGILLAAPGPSRQFRIERPPRA